MMKVLLALLALVAVATAVKPVKYRVEKARDLRERDVHYSRPCNGSLQFRCQSGECIQAEWECDTEKDCADGSDERNCTADCTGPHKFQCTKIRSCIASEYRCDGSNDCLDHSDESGCDLVDCSPGESKCDNDVCVEQHWFCDGQNDCSDNSDEKNCPSQAPCHDAYTGSVCSHLNQTNSPICLDHTRANLYCAKFCHLCS